MNLTFNVEVPQDKLLDVLAALGIANPALHACSCSANPASPIKACQPASPAPEEPETITLSPGQMELPFEPEPETFIVNTAVQTPLIPTAPAPTPPTPVPTPTPAEEPPLPPLPTPPPDIAVPQGFTTPSRTLDELRALVMALPASKRLATTTAVLAAYGVQKLSEIPEDKFGEAYERVQKGD
jgi:hypothetical protein